MSHISHHCYAVADTIAEKREGQIPMLWVLQSKLLLLIIPVQTVPTRFRLQHTIDRAIHRRQQALWSVFLVRSGHRSRCSGAKGFLIPGREHAKGRRTIHTAVVADATWMRQFLLGTPGHHSMIVPTAPRSIVGHQREL